MLAIINVFNLENMNHNGEETNWKKLKFKISSFDDNLEIKSYLLYVTMVTREFDTIPFVKPHYLRELLS